MQLHTFRGSTMADALVSVKRTLGPDAVIVHTRTFRVGGVMGVGGKEVVEITALAGRPAEHADAATDRPDRGSRARRPRQSAGPDVTPSRPAPAAPTAHAAAAPPAARPATVSASASPDSGPSTPHPSPHVMRVRQRGVLTSALRLASDENAAPLGRSIARQVLDANPSPGADHSAELRRELRDIRAMIERLASADDARRTPAPDASSPAALPASLFEHHLRLVQQHVSRELADRITRDVRASLTDETACDPDAVHEAILSRLVQLIPLSSTSVMPRRPSESTAFMMALVGPTGVGKTSTVAKLAAAYKLRQGLSVALITTDTTRVGAVEQLGGYARILDVPLVVAASAQDIEAARKNFAWADVVLVDTAGVSPRDAAGVSDLTALLSAADPTETHLVLAGTMSEPAMIAAARAFGPAAPNRVLFTKLDEAMTFGVILSVAATLGTHLSFVTNGQDLTGHIQAPSAERLARLALSPAA